MSVNNQRKIIELQIESNKFAIQEINALEYGKKILENRLESTEARCIISDKANEVLAKKMEERGERIINLNSFLKDSENKVTALHGSCEHYKTVIANKTARIKGLREEVAGLTEEKLSLSSQLRYSNDVIASLKAKGGESEKSG